MRGKIKGALKVIPGIKKIYAAYTSLKILFKLNLIKTLIVNFRFLKWREAIKFPIYVYGKLKISQYSHGSIVIDSPLRPGMILMGINFDDFSESRGCALLDIRGTLKFDGECVFSVDTTVTVLERAEIHLGRFVAIGNGCRIKCYSHIDIGAFTRIAVEAQVFDTNFHFIKNIKTGKICRNSSPIYIGPKCWIGNRTSIMHRTNLPEGCIVASNSLLNKDYVAKGVESNSLLAGMPAKVLGDSQMRIFSIRAEQELYNFFTNNSNETYNFPLEIDNEIEDLIFYIETLKKK